MRWTHYLFLVDASTAVGGCEGGGAGLAVPRHISILRAAADGQRVDAISVAITVTAVLLPATVTRRPDENWSESTTTLKYKRAKQKEERELSEPFFVSHLQSPSSEPPV